MKYHIHSFPVMYFLLNRKLEGAKQSFLSMLSESIHGLKTNRHGLKPQNCRPDFRGSLSGLCWSVSLQRFTNEI